MRVAAYVRESADPAEDRPAFAQQEEIRRHAATHGLAVVAVCQDVRQPGRALGRDGYRSLLAVIAADRADAVLVPGLATLSSDVVVQEIMLWDLRSRGVPVLSTDPGDLAVLGAEPSDPTRQFIRDVLARVAEHAAAVGLPAPSPGTPLEEAAGEGVTVSLIPPAPPEADPDPAQAARP